MRYEVYTLVSGTWRSRGEVNAASAEQAARIYSLRSGHRVVRVKPEGRLGEYKVFDFTRKSNPMARKRRKIKRNPRRTRRVKTWAKRVKRHRRKHNTAGRGFYTPAGRAVYKYLRSRKNPTIQVESTWSGGDKHGFRLTTPDGKREYISGYKWDRSTAREAKDIFERLYGYSRSSIRFNVR